MEFPDAHTAVNIAEELREILKLTQDKLSAVTTNNGTNIVAAFDITKWRRMPCFSHTPQHAVEVVLRLPEVSCAHSAYYMVERLLSQQQPLCVLPY